MAHARLLMPSCNYSVSEQPSPDGSWVAELYEDRCDLYVERAVLALRRAEEAPRQKKNIALTSSPGAPDTVIFGWLDNLTVALASFDGSAQSVRFDSSEPREFRGIKLAYFGYPNQPDASRDPGTRIIASRKIDFAYSFDPKDRPVAYPGVGCAIRISGEDVPNFDHIVISLYGFKEIEPRYDRAFAYVRVLLDNPTARPSISAIAVDEFNPPDWLHRAARKAQALWQVSSGDLMREISRLRTRSLDLKIGYFLDNAEIVYSNRNDFDIAALDQFERCVADNAVFSPSSNRE
jgi:hypothetical protein